MSASAKVVHLKEKEDGVNVAAAKRSRSGFFLFLVLLLFAAGANILFVKGFFYYQNWQEASRCMALVSNLEGNVLDRNGELLIDEVILNRARQIQSSEPFLGKVCQAARGSHWSAALNRRYPDFSALAQWPWYRTPEKRPGWHRSLSVAHKALWGWILWRRQMLPEEYTFYHTAPAPRSFERANGIACDLRHQYDRYGLDFCRKGSWVRKISDQS